MPSLGKEQRRPPTRKREAAPETLKLLSPTVTSWENGLSHDTVRKGLGSNLFIKKKIKGSKIKYSKQSTWDLTRQVANFLFCTV